MLAQLQLSGHELIFTYDRNAAMPEVIITIDNLPRIKCLLLLLRRAALFTLLCCIMSLPFCNICIPGSHLSKS